MAGITRTAVVACALMVMASVGAARLKPNPLSASAPAVSLEALVPQAFGAWRAVPASVQVVNPQTQALLDKLYSQVLNRTYVNARGDRVMLSIAYGDDQRGGLQAHMPEVCYPAQGFKLVDAVRSDTLALPQAPLPVRRLHARLGPRSEPITYWFTFGAQALSGAAAWEKRLIEFRFALTGSTPDGLLVRVSTLSENDREAFTVHDAFVRDLLASVPAETRVRFAGF